jgi:hypothetical protein
MKCHDIQKKIDLGLSDSSIDIDSRLRSHIESCRECGRYYKEISELREILNRQSFEVLPGELDGITLENIIRSEKPEIRKAGIFQSIFSLRWFWVPAAVAAVLLMLMVLPKNNDVGNSDSQVVQNNTIYLGDGVFVESEEQASALTASLVSDESELDLLADELIYESDVDDLLDSMTDEEFEILYERLKNINGSS